MSVVLDTEGGARVYRITVEHFDESLGWYTAGSLSLPLHQLPLLQQALDELGSAGTRRPETEESNTIIPVAF